MAERGVTAWWIERATGELCSHRFISLPNNGSYAFEVDMKWANDAVDTLIIHDDHAGASEHQFQALKTKSEQMVREIAASGE